MNRNWGKIENERLVYFDGQMRDGDTWIVAPTAADFARFGWLPVVDEPAPTPPDGYHYEPRGPVEKDGAIVRVTWELVANPPPPPRRWSRFTVKGALADAHLLPAAKQFLAAYELKPDYTALEAFTDVDYIEEGYGGLETWNALLNGAAGALGKTRAEIDAFLDQLPTEAN